MLQYGMLKNGTFTKRYIIKRYTNIMVLYNSTLQPRQAYWLCAKPNLTEPWMWI
jgi:hypothetical protein